MALAWITEIWNHTAFPVLLKQTDPAKNPVIDSVEGKGWLPYASPRAGSSRTMEPWSQSPAKPAPHEWFTVGPSTRLKTSWFVIPWSNQRGAWVYMIANHEDQVLTSADLEQLGVQFNVGPDGGGKNDYIQFYDRQLNPVVGSQTLDVGLAMGQAAVIPVGSAGGTTSASGRLNITDRSITYQISSSNSAGGDFLDAIDGVGQAIATIAGAVQAGAALA